MNYNLTEKFILLALDPKKGKFLIDTMSLNYGIAGAILLELSELNKISVINKRLVLSDKKLSGNFVIDESIKLINSSGKNRKTKYWVYKLGNKVSKFKKSILKDLNTKRIIKIEKKTYVWGLFKVYRYPFITVGAIEDTKSKLKGIVLKNEKPDIDNLLLLSLMNSCKLTRVLFTDKKQHRIARKKIKELTKDIEISEAVSQTIKEIQTAVMVATTSAVVSSSSS